ncbi:MAG: DUF104 domain-containing protein [Candidatus Methanoperedens sp.]|nr:DUF104 domain-containing protein [Candidatus Methanoperedens sp.]
MKIQAIYKDNLLEPSKKLNLHNGEKVQIEISNAVRRSKGIIRINTVYGKEIAKSDELSLLED